MLKIAEIDLRFQEDILFVMRLVRKYTQVIGITPLVATKLTTALSEICRNAFQYANGGRIALLVDNDASTQMFVAKVTDQGPGITDLDSILRHQYKSRSGMGVGIRGSQKLVDYFDISSDINGTEVSLGIYLPNHLKVGEREVSQWQKLAETERQFSPLQELKRQNRQLAEAYDIIQFKEEALHKANNKLQYLVTALSQKNAELEEFAHIVAHDLKSPLNVVFMSVEMAKNLYQPELTTNLRDVLDKVSGSAERMQRLIDDMLEYATHSSKSDKLELIDLNETVQEVVDLVSPPKNVQISYRNLPKVRYDATALKQVIQNFLTNAIKYNDKDITCINIDCFREGERRVLTFHDNGPGINPDNHEKIFRLFHTLGHHSNADSSTGIGLSVVKKIAERNDGTVWVESDPAYDTGTTFYFSILDRDERERPSDEQQQHNLDFLFMDLRKGFNSQ